jgi:hypothetical protein
LIHLGVSCVRKAELRQRLIATVELADGKRIGRCGGSNEGVQGRMDSSSQDLTEMETEMERMEMERTS